MPLRAYLDHNATSPLRPEARVAMIEAMDVLGNPSSIHLEGRAARKLVETARERIAALMDVHPKNIIFTSGGTEAANLALNAAARCLRHEDDAAPIVASSTEHACILNTAQRLNGAEAISVDKNGQIDPELLQKRLKTLGPAVVAVQDANSETGVQQVCLNSEVLYEDLRSLRVNDMVQTAGRVEKSDIQGHFAFISAHKFGGPKGVGALAWIGRHREEAPMFPFIHGGGQERGYRAGTENVIGIAGMAAAFEAADAQASAFAAWASNAQKRLEAGIKNIASDAVVFGENAPRLPNTTCYAVPGISADMALITFDLDGVSVSSGSACSSGKVAPSHVLKAMGVSDEFAACAIRVSTGWTNTDADIDRFLATLLKLCKNRHTVQAA